MLIAQRTAAAIPRSARRFGLSYTKFQSGFLLASYDLDGLGWRIGASACAAICSRPAISRATPSLMNEDGHATTVALSWQRWDWLRLTGEVIAMQSRRGEYVLAGFPSPQRGQQEFQLSAQVFLLNPSTVFGPICRANAGMPARGHSPR